MSKLDKEKVLAEYTEAYQKAHGKKPKIESSNGWYSVDGGKNVRLAQLADEAKALGKEKKSEAKKSEPKKTEAKKPAAKKAEPKKKAEKKPAAKKSTAKKSPAKKSSSGGLTAKELWKQKLENKGSDCRLPRGTA
ncbi:MULTISPECIES: hypothetical protein [Idiomarina]|jgi:FKBP-type peptidyl-prolyl cis-trans isomerase|uniref:hypothetical protein n=1 Tax=Idiomarina TaxID=135575 RepID=UPI000C405A9B|nr:MULTISPECIES: hypothetical protein [Idiomarina]MAO67308.1 hypothetical protein [Idiomarina sp.]MBF80106.1 hypothetical protein [Idiomarina sp.]|tara:strand:- start:1553 stop:1957 length:405 start_codon:yes stop_codon:yes gene_type:complete